MSDSIEYKSKEYSANDTEKKDDFSDIDEFPASDVEEMKTRTVEIINDALYGVVSFKDVESIDGDEPAPYAVPLCIIYRDDKLYFHTGINGKLNRIAKDGTKVCVTFVDNIVPAMDRFIAGYDSCIVKGRIFEITEDEVKKNILEQICNHFCPTNMNRFEQSVKKHLSQSLIYCITMDETSVKSRALSMHEEDYGDECS